jgi:cation diffusion facilitator family transporter
MQRDFAARAGIDSKGVKRAVEGTPKSAQTNDEQATLKFSISLTVLLGVLGVASGLSTGSQAIIFDGMYSFVDVIPTIVSLVVVKLIAQGSSHRFQYGYWHLEPLVAVFRNSILVIACIYAAIDAVNSLASGGHEVSYGLAAGWAAILSVFGLAMTLLLSKRAKRLQSPMLKLDAHSWMVSAVLSLALLVGFAFAMALTGTAWQPWVPYLDAIALLCMAVLTLPMPLLDLWRSMRDVLQVVPDELDQQVHALMRSIVSEQGFKDYSSYVAKAGRARFVEIHILLSSESQMNVGAADAIRATISQGLGAAVPNFWLTIDFTADRRWL